MFSREIEALGKKGDVLLLLSTSGNSRNILKAAEKAKKMGMRTVGLTGKGGMLKERVDISLAVSSAETPRIQETHLLIIHILSELVENAFF